METSEGVTEISRSGESAKKFGESAKKRAGVSIWRFPVRRIGETGSPTTHKGETTMRFMVIVKADKSSEAGALPDEKLLAAMGKYNEELAKAGVLLAGEGLHPSSKGARVRFSGSQRTVIDGPFSESKELVAGFWLFQVRSKEEAIEWVKRSPNPGPGDSEIEIRQVFEAEDFGPAMTPEIRDQEERTRAKADRNTIAKP
jgi:hypothetical protein